MRRMGHVIKHWKIRMVPKQCSLLIPTFWYIICSATCRGWRDNSKYHTIPSHPNTYKTEIGFASIFRLRLRAFGAQPPSKLVIACMT